MIDKRVYMFLIRRLKTKKLEMFLMPFLMLIGGPRKLNTLEEFTLAIKEKELDRVN